jgi:hypothetical protein
MNGANYEFRKHAGRCRLEAENAAEMADRAFWLLLAENWQKLAQESEDKPKQELEAQIKSAFRLQ